MIPETAPDIEQRNDTAEEVVADTLGQTAVRAEWLERSENARALSGSGVNSFSGQGDVHTMGYQGGYRVSEIPIALPVAGRDTLDPTDAHRVKPWADMDRLEQVAYGSPNDESDIAFDDLTPEVKQTILAHRAFEIQAKSKDVTEISKASQRNRERVETGTVLKPTDVTHATRPENLAKILDSGLLATELLGEDAVLDKFPYNLDVSSIPPDAGQYRDSYASIMRRSNFHATGNVLLVLDRSEEATDFNNEVVGDPNDRAEGHRLIFAGVPSTEVAAVCVEPIYEHSFDPEQDLHDARQTTLQSIDQVLQHGQYIPVLDHEGNLALTPEEFDARRASGDYGNFVKREFIREEVDEAPVGPGSYLDF